jgi:hypothetical protein
MIFNTFGKSQICLLVGLFLIGVVSWANATTKGLNQIVTPDIQTMGQLSISMQGQASAIGNSEELQYELGITKNFEVAVFQGFNPGETMIHTELGIIQTKSFLLSTGILDIENGMTAQPFIEAGYYYDNGKGALIAGAQYQSPGYVAVLGADYQISPRLLVAVDYLGGSVNFLTAGITYSLTPELSFNPALYIGNADHGIYGYGVLTYNIKM